MSTRILGLFRLTKGELYATIYYCILASAVAKERTIVGQGIVINRRNPSRGLVHHTSCP